MLTNKAKVTQQEYEDIKLQLNVTPILQLVQKKSEDELLKLLHVEMREKKRMDHCRRIYQRLRFMMNRAYDKEYIDECRHRDIKIPDYIKQTCGIKE
jgi:hypothetical protein